MLTHKSLFVLLFAAALTGCDLTSKAIVVVNTPGAVTAPQTPIAPASPSVVPTSPQVTQQPATSQPSSPATVINIPVSAPSASVSVSADLSIFKTKIPRPSDVKGYLRTEIAQATEHFKQRYEANKGNAFEVLKMALDAELVGTGNLDLRNSLIETLLPQNGDVAERSKLIFTALKTTKNQESDVAIYYQNATIIETLNRIDYADFDNRILQIVKEDLSGSKIELIPISRPEDFIPASPKDGDLLTLNVKLNDSHPHSSYYAPSFKFIFDGGWRYIWGGLK